MKNIEMLLIYSCVFRFFVKCTEHWKFVPNSKDILFNWDSYKHHFNKTYSGIIEERRKLAWTANLNKIIKHNLEAMKGLHSYYIGPNHLTDMSTKTYLQKMVKLTKSNHRTLDPLHIFTNFSQIIHKKSSMNWLERGFKMPDFNQKNCGSCYAFSTVTAIEAQVFKRTHKQIHLSEQQVVDCSSSWGNQGCGGGSLRNTLKYLVKTGGLMTASDYPYIAKQRKCHFNKDLAAVNISSWVILPPRNEQALEIAVSHIGPVAVSLNASPHTFQLYHSGIYDDPHCSSNTVNHAMLIIGFTPEAWILKNWWGHHWGEKGYMKIRRHRNRCGISNFAGYALI